MGDHRLYFNNSGDNLRPCAATRQYCPVVAMGEGQDRGCPRLLSSGPSASMRSLRTSSLTSACWGDIFSGKTHRLDGHHFLLHDRPLGRQDHLALGLGDIGTGDSCCETGTVVWTCWVTTYLRRRARPTSCRAVPTVRRSSEWVMASSGPTPLPLALPSSPLSGTPQSQL